MMQSKQKGFTLLELLVVITLLAVLSVGALIAYDGVGDNAQAVAASNNTAGADRAIRNYRAIALTYPDQWDNLVTSTGLTPVFLNAETQAAFADWNIGGVSSAFASAVHAKLEGVGISNIQQRTTAALTANVEPNLQHNEGAVGTDASEDAITAVTHLSILPSYGTAGCAAGGVSFGAKLDAAPITAVDGNRANVIHDALEGNECNLVIALGFGHDAAHSTSGSSVAVSTAPTFVSKDINPAKNYARYIALFHVGNDGHDGSAVDGQIGVSELLTKPTLLAVVDTEGQAIDENIAKQNP